MSPRAEVAVRIDALFADLKAATDGGDWPAACEIAGELEGEIVLWGVCLDRERGIEPGPAS